MSPRAIARPAPSESEMPRELAVFNADEWPPGWGPAEDGDTEYAALRLRYGEISWAAHRRLWIERENKR